MGILNATWQNLSNASGWRIKRKILVIESDDWGSIRMPSLNSFDRLEKSGLDLRSADAERYNLNDTLATSHDLESLFEVLSNFKDMNGNCAVFTPISIVANPDFQKIKESSFQEYFYEPFTETLKRYPGCEHSFELWKEGVEKKLFVPQMHGREHLNVTAWMKALQTVENNTLLAFKEGMWGFVADKYPEIDYLSAFLLTDSSELEYQKSVISKGLQLFEKLFGYRPEYFVPPNGPFNNNLNKVLVENGIKFRSASKIQKEPLGNNKSRNVIHWLGQRDSSGIRYITRNCFFEPGQNKKDWVESCMHDIKIAFRWHKPAIISSHRVNYVGALHPANRDNGLLQLSRLLQKIIRNWSNVEFMTTPQLGALMNKDLNNA
jgi:hypothetical protein